MNYPILAEDRSQSVNSVYSKTCTKFPCKTQWMDVQDWNWIFQKQTYRWNKNRKWIHPSETWKEFLLKWKTIPLIWNIHKKILKSGTYCFLKVLFQSFETFVEFNTTGFNAFNIHWIFLDFKGHFKVQTIFIHSFNLFLVVYNTCKPLRIITK